MKKIWICLLITAAIFTATEARAQYWKIGADTTQVWSLVDNALVPISDTTYVAWVAFGNFATPIASTSELYDVISQSYPAHLAASAQPLETAGGLRPPQSFEWRKARGLNIVYTGVSPLNGLYAIDDQWMGGLISGAFLRCDGTPLLACAAPFPTSASTYDYLDKQFVIHTMSIVQMRVIALAIEDYVADLYAQLKVGLDGGTPAWPGLTRTVP